MIDCVWEATFLGVVLDEHLTWKSHIHNFTRKESKGMLRLTGQSENSFSLHFFIAFFLNLELSSVSLYGSYTMPH